MNTYGWSLLGQTLLALWALGLAGGWALWPFRRADRPYLWLAGPLAGLLTLGGTLAVLYFFAGLPFRACLWTGFVFNSVATVACLVRGRPALPPLGRRTVATVVVTCAAYWGTVSCNKTSIDAREPTLAAMDGSDMFGYAITADWLRTHTTAQPPRINEPFEVLIHVNLQLDAGRQLAFLLPAAAAEVRGTTALFSYDWASGVILSAALLGFGAVFATNPLMLVLLVAGGGASNWLTNARSGYLGRSIAYPCTILLAGLFLSVVGRFTWSRVAVLAGLGAAVAFALAPVFVTVALGMVVGCYLGALVVTYPIARPVVGPDGHERPAAFRPDVLRAGALAVLAYVATVGPAFAVHYTTRSVAVPRAPTDWPVVIPVSLDLESPTLRALTPETETKFLYACAAALLVFAGIALRHRQPVALALVCCALVVPISWALGQNLLHTFQGIVYPLTLAGAALLAAPLAASRWGAARVAVLATLAVCTIGLRVPQARATADRYLYSVQPHRAVLRQSDAAAIRALVGDEAVDVAVGHYTDNHLVLAELVTQGVRVRLRSPGWDRSLRNWARVVQCPEPDLLAPKSRFSLVERNAYAPPGTERYVGTRLKLIEDRDAVSVLGVADTQDMTWDSEWRPGVWIGTTPTTFLIHNGTGQERSVRLLGLTSAGPAHPDRERRTLRYRLNDQTGTRALPKENDTTIPLRLAPGLNHVELTVLEAPDPPVAPRQPVKLLEFRNWRLEPGE